MLLAHKIQTVPAIFVTMACARIAQTLLVNIVMAHLAIHPQSVLLHIALKANVELVIIQFQEAFVQVPHVPLIVSVCSIPVFIILAMESVTLLVLITYVTMLLVLMITIVLPSHV